jgi:hypothetical protein
MCVGGGGGGGIPPYVQIQMQQEQMVEAQKQADAALAQQKQIADAQAKFNQDQFDYQKQQDAARQADADAQAGRQAQWDTTRNQNATTAQNEVEAAFSKFTPAYFDQYKSDIITQNNAEVQRQADVATKNLAFGMARQGILGSSAAADQQGLLEEQKGRTEADIANQAQQSETALQNSTLQAKTGLLGQALSTDTLGQPIAPGSSAGVSAAIDTANRAISSIGSTAADYTTALKATPPNYTLGNIFGSIAGSAGNFISGQQAAQYAAAFGGSGPSGGSPSGGGSVRTY